MDGFMHLIPYMNFYNQGNDFFDSCEYEDAIKKYDYALGIAPNTPEILYRNAEALYKLKLFVDAAEIFWVAYLYMRFRKEPLLMCGRSLEMAGLTFHACRVFSMLKLSELDLESAFFIYHL